MEGQIRGTKMAYSVAHLVFSRTEKKHKKGAKSNIKTPKNNPGRALTSLRGPPDNSLEFPYWFLDQISAFSQIPHPFSDPGSDSGGPTLPF